MKDSEWLRIALGDLLGKFTIEEVCEQLTLLAEVILQDIVDESLAEVGKKYGKPSLPFAILGLGKIGGGEMTFGSDLDLIFVMDDTCPNDSTEKHDDPISPVEYFTDVSSRVIKRLKEPTNFGILYDIDTRLRPYGSKGILVISLTQLKDYYEHTADIWEKMALMKARVVAENGTFTANLQETIKNLSFYCLVSTEDVQRSEDIRMKMVRQTNSNNLKKSEGGMAELEYAVRWWQHMKVKQCPQLATPSVIKALNILNELYPEQSQQWTFLKETFDIYIKILNRHRLFTGIRSSTLSEQTLQFLPHLLPEMDLSPSPIEFLNNTKNKVHQFYVKTLQTVEQWLKENS